MFIIVLMYSAMIPIKHLLESKRKSTFLCKSDIWLYVHTDNTKDKSTNVNTHKSKMY